MERSELFPRFSKRNESQLCVSTLICVCVVTTPLRITPRGSTAGKVVRPQKLRALHAGPWQCADPVGGKPHGEACCVSEAAAIFLD